MPQIPPDWSRFDVLIRELGALSTSSRTRDEKDAEVSASVDRHILAAAQAVDALIDDPDSEEKAIAAWEQILVGQDFIGHVKKDKTGSGTLTRSSSALRRMGAAAMASDMLHGRHKRG